MQALQKSPRFKFDRPIYDFESLKPRILRAAYAALQNSDETFWKGKCFVSFHGWIQFEVAFPRGYKFPKCQNPLEKLQSLYQRAGERQHTNPDIALIKERIKNCLRDKDFVNLHDYLDDYEEILEESIEERNRYFYGLLIKTINGFKWVHYPEHHYINAVDYNSPLIIRKVRLEKKLDGLWHLFDNVKPYLRQDKVSPIDSKLNHLNTLIIDAPSIETIEDSIDQLNKKVKESLDRATIDWLFEEALKAASNKMQVIHERNRILFSSKSEEDSNVSLALLFKKTVESGERSKETPHPKAEFKLDFDARIDRLNGILAFLSSRLKRYPIQVLKTNGAEMIANIENSLIHDPDVV
ncbi:MAG: hypothetical protein ACK4HV_02055, partial [Parachlamydiaceae bacterium]